MVSAGAAGAFAYGASGGPFLPQAVVTNAASTHAYTMGRIRIEWMERGEFNGWLSVCDSRSRTRTWTQHWTWTLQRIYRERSSLATTSASIRLTYASSMVTLVAEAIRCVKGDLVEQSLHHRVQAPGADVLGLLVHLGGQRRHALDRVFGERDLDAFGRQQRDVLLHQGALGLGEDADEVVAAPSASSSTRMGNRPWSSGMRSDGLDT